MFSTRKNRKRRGLVKRDERVGELFNTNLCGTCKIIRYDSSSSVYVRFTKSGVIKRCSYGALVKGEVYDNMYLGVDRLHTLHKTPFGDIFVVGYKDNRNVWVKFLKTNNVVKTSWRNVTIGNIKDKQIGTCKGFGIIGTKYNPSSQAGTVWYGIVQRCLRGYADLYEEWQYLDNFGDWYYKNHYGGDLHIDKDLLSGGGKLYSPNTCIMLPSKFNSMISKFRGAAGYIQRTKNSYQVRIKINGRPVVFGSYKDPETAHNVYRREKSKHVKSEALKAYLAGEIPDNVYTALLEWEPDDIFRKDRKEEI